jgi:Mn2+/Fe2+ NRAMP family transporter
MPKTEQRSSASKAFGPGFISAASSNDPTTVATLAVVGATTGYTLAWLVVLLFPMLVVVQTIAAAIGAVCRTSVQGAIRLRYGTFWALVSLVAVVAVNVFTLTADVEAACVALRLLTGIPYQYFVIPFVAVAAWLLVAHRYSRVERILSFLPFIFLAYGASAILAHADWHAVLRAIVIPTLHLNAVMVGGALALLGTTLTAYVYIWESIEVAERGPKLAGLRWVKLDAALGMLVVTITFLFILVATGATLGAHGISVQTAEDAALALHPLAGAWSASLFGIGLLGSALLAVPVIAGTTGYAVAQTFRLPGTLDATFSEARTFYGSMLVALGLAGALSFVRVSPIALLYWASVAAGIATPVTLYFLVRLARDTSVMAEHRIGAWLAGAGWAVTALMTAAVVLYLALLARA